MKNVVEKITGAGNANVLVTERGVSFGYNTLVTDMRALPLLAKLGAPVIFDATHSVQQPGGQGTSSGGERDFVPVLARAAVAVGVAGVFIETHQDPDRAPSDGPNMLPLKDLEPLLERLMAFDKLAKAKTASSLFQIIADEIFKLTPVPARLGFLDRWNQQTRRDVAIRFHVKRIHCAAGGIDQIRTCRKLSGQSKLFCEPAADKS